MIAAPSKSLGTTLLERIGNTPLIRLDQLTAHLPGIQILGKAEWMNPGGSVKDRAGSNIVKAAFASGQLGAPAAPGKPVQHLLDATSGNTGIAYGANVNWTDPADGSDGAIRLARKLAADNPEKFFYADQYGNDNNWLAHYHGTANEIWQQTEGAVTHFVAALGTSGTFMGTTRRLRELNPKIRCISMQPDSPFNGLEGLKHMATAIVPPIYDPTLADANIDMATERAYAMAKWLGRNQGLLIGVSAAASVTAALQVAEVEAAAGREAVIVTILCDSADKYLSERFWSDPIAADLELAAKLIPRSGH
jgi:cysteine synthase B